MKYTETLNLVLYEGSDKFSITAEENSLNANTKKIDAEVKNILENVDNVSSDIRGEIFELSESITEISDVLTNTLIDDIEKVNGRLDTIKGESENALAVANQAQSDVDELKKSINNFEPGSADIIIGDIYAVVGDTIQIFFKSIIDADLDNVIFRCSCSKGKNYARYWEYTPTVKDVGSTKMFIDVYSKGGAKLASKIITVKTVSATNPSDRKNVLCLGEGTMQRGNIAIEASRRIRGTAGDATTPQALNLSNINFVGRKKNADNTVGWEGTGAYTFSTYTSKGETSIRFYVTGATDLNIDDTYEIDNRFKLDIAEINVTDGEGDIRCTFDDETPYTMYWMSTPFKGTLTKLSGNGQNSIAYTDWNPVSYQPFWNYTTKTLDISSYINTYCDGKLDVICVLLGMKSIRNFDAFFDLKNTINTAKLFCDEIHAQLPNCKILVSTLPLINQNNGDASDYMCGYDSNGFNHKVFGFNKGLIEFAESDEYKSFVTVVSSHAQFDSENGYQTTTKQLNTRTAATETIIINTFQPNDCGYWQLADALAFRALLANI